MMHRFFDSQQKQLRVIVVGGLALLLMNVLAIWPHHSTTPAPAITPPHSETKPQTPAKQPTVTAAASNKSRYLVIREWGVKLPLNDELRDATYTLNGNEVRFSTQRLEAFGCRPTAIGLPMGLERTELKQISSTNTRDLMETSFKQLNGHWFALTGAQAICFDHSPNELPASIATLYQQAAGSIEQALRQLQPA